jgi:peptidoglycan/LPS O-acetylase OafA/YrhL
MSPAEADGTVLFFQHPFLRLVISGSAWVAVFFILLGLVNALKAIKQARAGDLDKSLKTICQSCFKRIFRLVLPASAITCLSWLVTNLYIDEMNRNIEGQWLVLTSPHPSQSFAHAWVDLLNGLANTWSMNDNNQYDTAQWVLVWLLSGSIFVNAALLLTLPFRPIFRVFALIALAIWSLDWSYKANDPQVGMAVFSGIIFAELSCNRNLLRKLFEYSPILSPWLLVSGLFMMSYPATNFERAIWSTNLDRFTRLFATRIQMWPRFGSTIGALLFITAIIISPFARRLLSTRFPVWLGSISYSVYLLHTLLMRTVLTWAMCAGTPLLEHDRDWYGPWQKVMSHPMPGMFRGTISVIIFGLVLGVVAHLWTAKVEPYFARFTDWAMKLFYAEERKDVERCMKVREDRRVMLVVESRPSLERTSSWPGLSSEKNVGRFSVVEETRSAQSD